MDAHALRSNTPISLVRWTARILSLGSVVLLMIIAVGESWNSPIPWTRLSPLELGMFAALGLALSGLLAAWRWELTGALMSIGGTTLFTLGIVARKGLHFRYFWIEGALAIIGLMFMVCWCGDRQRSSSR